MSRGEVKKSCTAMYRAENQACTLTSEPVNTFEALLKYPPRASAIIPPTIKKMIDVCNVRGN
jgi:hypothetical protein